MLDLYVMKALGSSAAAAGGGKSSKEPFAEEGGKDDHDERRRRIIRDEDVHRRRYNRGDDDDDLQRRRYNRDDDRYSREHRRDDDVVKGIAIFTVVIYIVWMLLFGIPAVYFSWTSNGLIGWNVGMKIFFAFFAFLSGLSYLFIHLINKLDMYLFIKQARMGMGMGRNAMGQNTAMVARGSFGNGNNR